MKKTRAFFLFFFVFLFIIENSGFARNSKAQPLVPPLSARAAVIMDSQNGGILYSKNPELRLPPASTTKVMTALLAIEHLPLSKKVKISRNAYNIQPSKAGLSLGAEYRAGDLIAATLISSSNDAAVALAEAVAGNEERFAGMMNEKARKLGMKNTVFINSTGLTDKKERRRQFSTAYDLARLMSVASKDRRVDYLLGIMETKISGSDGKAIILRSHNKMLWRMPHYVKGKTGWTTAAKHTFVGTNYEPRKQIFFAMLASQKPWTDIENLTEFGLLAKANQKNNFFWNLFRR